MGSRMRSIRRAVRRRTGLYPGQLLVLSIMLGAPVVIVVLLLMETETIASWVKWMLAGLFVLWLLGFGLPRLRR